MAFEFGQITEQNGLSNNHVNDFLNDKDGYLWIATDDGLSRFDGCHFDVFKSNYKKTNTLLHNTTIALCEDKNSNIWVANLQGISCYNKKSGVFLNFKTHNNLPIGKVLNILCDKRGLIWFSSQFGLFCINPDKFSFESSISQPILIPVLNNQNTLVEDSINNGLWIGSDIGLSFLDLKTKQISNKKNNSQRIPILNNSVITALAIDAGKLIYADNTNNELIIFDLVKQKIIKKYPFEGFVGNTSAFAIATFIDKKHNIWLSFNMNSFIIDAQTDEIKEIESKEAAETISIKSFSFQNAWQSVEGTVWLGVYGIYTTNPDKVPYKSYDIGNLTSVSDKNDQITAFAQDRNSTWWLGNWRRELIHFSSNSNKIEVFPLPKPTKPTTYHPYVHSIEDLEGNLYLAVFDGVFLFNKITKKFKKFDLPSKIDGVDVKVMRLVVKDHYLWIRTNVSTVFCYQFNTKKWQEYTLNSFEIDLNTTRRFLIFDNKGELWVNLYPQGLAKFSNKENKFISENIINHNEFEYWFSKFVSDDNNNLWFSTAGFGLVKYDTKTKTYQNWRESDGLVFDDNYAVIIDKSKNVWVGSLNKFSMMDKNNHFVNFTLPYNKGVSTYRNLMYLLKTGNILSVQKNILVEFKHQNFHTSNTQGNLLISSIQLSNESTIFLNSLVKEIDLDVDQNNFDIKFASFSVSQETNNYFYKLTGIDKDWINAGTKTIAHYTNVAGGNYEFMVKVVSPSNKAKTQSIKINIATVFYKTWWFLILLVSLLFFLAYEFYRYRLNQNAKVLDLKIQTTRLEKTNTEIQYQNLINHLNPHFLFNSLTSLNSLISINPKQASKFLKQLSLIYRYILQNKDKEMVSLEEEISFVQHYIELQKSRFEDGLKISIKIEKGNEKLKIVPVTIQNLLENAIKHNILDDENPLIISIYTYDNYLIVENILQKKHYVGTSNKQGLASLQSLYHYLTNREFVGTEIEGKFVVKVPLL